MAGKDQEHDKKRCLQTRARVLINYSGFINAWRSPLISNRRSRGRGAVTDVEKKRTFLLLPGASEFMLSY